MADFHALLFGRGIFVREGAPEPSLLPLLARTVHDDQVDPLFRAARLFGQSGSSSPPWFSLWEAVLDQFLANPVEGRMVPPSAGISEREIDLRARLRAGIGGHAAAGMATELLGSPEAHLAARLAPVLPGSSLGRVLDALDPVTLPAESARALLESVPTLAREPYDSWFVDLVVGAGTPIREPAFSRKAHLFPHLPSRLRAELASGLLRASIKTPLWYQALVAARIGPISPRERVGGRRPEPWDGLIRQLLSTKALGSPWADVIAAHPFRPYLREITGRHEISGVAIEAMNKLWGGACRSAGDGVVLKEEEPPTEVDCSAARSVTIGCVMEPPHGSRFQPAGPRSSSRWRPSDAIRENTGEG